MIPLYKPYMPQSLPELQNILYSGSLSYGKWGRNFEQKLVDFIGLPNIGVVNSFNSAMLVVLATLDIKPDDEIIASPMSCLASNQPFASVRAKVIWADIDPFTGTLCPESVKAKISGNTKAIFHNHHCGYPGYIDEINTIGKEKGIYVIDDAIEAFGAEYKGKMMGNTGTDATVFSFQTVRMPNTIDGGAFSFKDAGLFEKACVIRDLGVNRAIFRDAMGEISAKCDITDIGYGATLCEPNSYIGSVQIDELNSLIDQQRANASEWSRTIESEKPDLKLLSTSQSYPNYWVFGVLSNNKFKTIIDFREIGFNASGVHLPNNNYSVFKNDEELPGVNEFYNQFVALPSGWWFDIKNLNEVNV